MLCCILGNSCQTNNSKNNYTKIIGDSIQLQKLSWTYYGNEVIKNNKNNYKYYIIKYIDSIGCVPCKVNYQQLRKIVDKFNIASKLVGIKMIINNKNKNKVIAFAKRENVVDPIAFDTLSNMQKKFFYKMHEMTMLIDRNGKILAIGDPTKNIEILKEYYNVLALNLPKKITFTDGYLSTREIDFGQIKANHKSDTCLYIINKGNKPLVINDIQIACGCLNVKCMKNIIMPNQMMKCDVTITPSKGYFIKNIEILSNSVDPLHFKVIGNAI